MDSFATPLNLPKRKVKGLVKLFAGISCPWYFTTAASLNEGTPMVPSTTKDQIDVATQGATLGAKVIGLALQEVYDESTFGQLKGYHFANDTRQSSLAGKAPIGLLTGAGWAATNNFWGTVAYGDQAAIGASGKLVKQGTNGAATGDKLPVIFEGAGTNGTTMVRIRFDFPLNIIP